MRCGTASVATFLGSDIEVDEFVVAASSPADGAMVRDLGVARDVSRAVVRTDGRAEIVTGGTELHAGDRVVLFVNPAALDDVRQILGTETATG